VLWQTGKAYFDFVQSELARYDKRRLRVFDFLREMDLAYASADVVISRSGALAVSELCIAQKPCILVPSPNVAEDHQTKNATALVEKEAALMVPDKEARAVLVDEALKLLFDEQRCAKLSGNISRLARPHATEDIVTQIENLITA
jgi:UDP-N-acetylglucosamine--N-acetylmuramyl-(pentapeptide) pyrophosphoryl-undecaprenol N-acetylglucosamine transferase